MSRLNQICRALALLLVLLPLAFEMIDRVFGEVAFFAPSSLSTLAVMAFGGIWIYFLCWASQAQRKERARVSKLLDETLLRAMEHEIVAWLESYGRLSFEGRIRGLKELLARCYEADLAGLGKTAAYGLISNVWHETLEEAKEMGEAASGRFLIEFTLVIGEFIIENPADARRLDLHPTFHYHYEETQFLMLSPEDRVRMCALKPLTKEVAA